MIKLKIGKEEIIYSDDDLASMTRKELKQLKQDLQCNIEDVSSKRSRYQATNNDAYNSKEYYTRLAKYKCAIVSLRKSIAKVSLYERELIENDSHDREHWLWAFYTTVKHNADEKTFEEYVKLADEKSKYHVEIGE